MKYVFIVNPHAGAENNAEKIREALSALPENDLCEVYETRAVMDAAAVALARDNGIAVVVFCMHDENALVRTLAGEGAFTEITDNKG